MRRYIWFMVWLIAGLSFVVLGSRGGYPKNNSNSTSALTAIDCTKTYSLAVDCCPDTQKSTVVFTKVQLVGFTAADSTWIALLPATLHFMNVATGPAKPQRVTMPGMTVEPAGKGAKK